MRVLQEIRGKAGRVLPAGATPDLLMVNCTPVKLDYIRLLLICLQMGIPCEIVIKELNQGWFFCSWGSAPGRFS